MSQVVRDAVQLAKKDKDEDDDEGHGKKHRERSHKDSFGAHHYAYGRGDCKYKYKENEYGYKEEYKCKKYNKKSHKYKKKKYKYQYEANGCKYKYEESAKGYKEEYKCKRRRSHQAAGGGYWPKYRKQGARVETSAPFGIDLGSCNRELLGAAVGAAAGGLVGAQIGDGTKQVVAVAGGTFLGLVLGSQVGRSIDELDEGCAGQALEHAGDDEPVAWENPDRGTRYELTPTSSFNDSQGRYCREYQTQAVVSGQVQEAFGQACRQPDGSWQILN